MAKVTKKPCMILVRLSEEDFKKFNEICEEKRRNRSDMLRIIIQDYIKLIDA